MDDLDLTGTSTYLSLVEETDCAYKNLISYFSTCDEKTIILMFGDHQPTVDPSFIERLYGKKYDSLSEEELALRYQTPFLLWANYDIEGAQDINISANYLSSLLLDTANLPKTAYFDYLSNLYHSIPVITANFCYDAEGNFYSASDFDKLTDQLNDYEILQYNHLFDYNNRASGFSN